LVLGIPKEITKVVKMGKGRTLPFLKKIRMEFEKEEIGNNKCPRGKEGLTNPK